VGFGHLSRWKRAHCRLYIQGSFLPYVEIVTQREYSYKCVMIDEERILVLKVRFEYCRDVDSTRAGLGMPNFDRRPTPDTATYL
jgi:hypothetical protein